MSDQTVTGNIRKPAAVIATVIVLAIFSAVTLLQGFASIKKGGSFIGSQIIGIFFYIGLFSLILNKKWARLYCSLLLLFMLLLFLGSSCFLLYQKGLNINNVFISALSVGLLGWLCYSFILGTSSKEYYEKLTMLHTKRID
jgi:putative effector of murein hydrolase LrgA (UPF0299 family)